MDNFHLYISFTNQFMHDWLFVYDTRQACDMNLAD